MVTKARNTEETKPSDPKLELNGVPSVKLDSRSIDGGA